MFVQPIDIIGWGEALNKVLIVWMFIKPNFKLIGVSFNLSVG